jgi:hypothetical protein
MKELLRKLRGLLGFGATWGTLWAGIGAGVGALLGVLSPAIWTWSNPILDWAVGLGVYGLVSGVGFATILALGEGRKTLFDLKLGRVALWGVLGSAAVPLLFMGFFEAGTTVADIIGAIAVTGALGGTFAPGSVALARREALRAAEEPALLGRDPLSD